jgi:hypothetical protein
MDVEIVPVECVGVIGVAVKDHEFDRHDAEPIADGPARPDPVTCG